jgi:hypothetical protein
MAKPAQALRIARFRLARKSASTAALDDAVLWLMSSFLEAGKSSADERRSKGCG